MAESHDKKLVWEALDARFEVDGVKGLNDESWTIVDVCSTGDCGGELGGSEGEDGHEW